MKWSKIFYEWYIQLIFLIRSAWIEEFFNRSEIFEGIFESKWNDRSATMSDRKISKWKYRRVYQSKWNVRGYFKVEVKRSKCNHVRKDNIEVKVSKSMSIEVKFSRVHTSRGETIDNYFESKWMRRVWSCIEVNKSKSIFLEFLSWHKKRGFAYDSLFYGHEIWLIRTSIKFYIGQNDFFAIIMRGWAPTQS